MYAYSNSLSNEVCDECGFTLHIITVTEDTDEMVAELHFTCLTCSHHEVKTVQLEHYVLNVRPNMPHLHQVSCRNWWIKPKQP